MNTIRKRKQAIINQSYCVACGNCTKVCPLGAIDIAYGMYAKVNTEKCVGCGKCVIACPASIIHTEVITEGM